MTIISILGKISEDTGERKQEKTCYEKKEQSENKEAFSEMKTQR